MATRGPAKPVDPKSIADPVARARALRAARQSNPVSAGLAKSPVAGVGAGPNSRPGSASPKMMHNPRSPAAAGPVDRTLGARKRQDHLAPKKSGVDHRLAGFTTASRTVKRRPSDGILSSSPDVHDSDDHDGAVSPHPTAPGTSANGAGASRVAAAEPEDPTAAVEAAITASVRGDDEDWFAAIQRKEEEERQRKEDEAREAKRQQEKAEKDAKEDEARRRRKEGSDLRRAELEEARRRKQAERREQSDKGLEDLARTREAELAHILQSTAAPESTAVRVTEERHARKARIAELVSRVKGVSVAGDDDSDIAEPVAAQ